MALQEKIIKGDSGINAGYVTELIMIDIDDILFVNDPVLFGDAEKPFTVLNGNIGINTNADFYRIRFRNKSCTFSESNTPNAAGNVYQQNVNLDIPKNQEALLNFLHLNQERNWFCLLKDANEKCSIVGEPGFGAKLRHTRTISGGINNIGISLNCLSYHSAWMVESIDPQILFASTFSDEFSEDFEITY